MNTFCVPITLDLEPLTKPYNRYGTDKSIKVPTEDISSQFVDFLLQRNIAISFIELFYNTPFRISPIHVDGPSGDYAKINFVYGGPKSVMCWYNANTPKTEISHTHLNTRYISYKSNEVTPTHRQNVHSPSIVQVGIPHNIVNTGQPRWCISVVPMSAKTQQRIPFQNMVDLFKDRVC
jgi:hypothetical protein